VTNVTVTLAVPKMGGGLTAAYRYRLEPGRVLAGKYEVEASGAEQRPQ
jgi:hypothetical protein